jgi:putative hydrolase of the HAD superfamily
MDIQKYFYEVYTSVEIGIKKPNMEIFTYALDDLEVKSSNAVFVGDNYNDDYLGAKRVGMDCYLIDKHNKYDSSINTRIKSVFELTDTVI